MPTGIYKRKDRVVLFFEKVHQIPFHTCWEWVGGIGESGHGVFYNGNNKFINAHRFSYLLHIGEINEGKVIMHTCDNRRCVNPTHLVQGTQRENLIDCTKKGRHPFIKKILSLEEIAGKKIIKNYYRKTRKNRDACVRGHDNTKQQQVYTRKNGWFECKECIKIYKKKFHLKRKGGVSHE